jgi:hypothetical protein
MKIDLYTKGILTVIALSLVVMAFKDVDPISKVFAHNGDVVHKIAICNETGKYCSSLFSDVNGGWRLGTHVSTK